MLLGTDKKKLQHSGIHLTHHDGTDVTVAPSAPEVMCSLQPSLPEVFALHSATWCDHALGHSGLLSLSASEH